MGKIGFIIISAGIMLMLTGIVTSVYSILEDDGEKEIVKCYDRFLNEIIGAECIKPKYNDSFYIGILSIMMGFMITAVGLIWVPFNYKGGAT